jgi:hypothetical protein
VTVVDNDGCEAMETFTVFEPAALTVVVTTTADDCPNATGTATAVPSGGNPGYTYDWTGRVETSATLTDLPAGFYTVTVTDTLGCTAQSGGTVECGTQGPPGGFIDAIVSPVTATNPSDCERQYCQVSARLYDGMAILRAQISLRDFPAGVTIESPPLENQFYGSAMDDGCSSGITIYNPAAPFDTCPLDVKGLWEATNVSLSTWNGGSLAFPCQNYLSQAAPALGQATIPVAQLSFNGLATDKVTGMVTMTAQDLTVWEFDMCCGCDCLAIKNPAPPLACNAPVDLNTELPQNLASGKLNQQGFIPFEFDFMNPVGTTLNDPLSGLEFGVISGSLGFNNVYQNFFPAVPNNLMLDGLGSGAAGNPEYVGVSIFKLQAGTYKVQVWIFDQDVPSLQGHYAYWAPFDPSNPTNFPSVPVAGPFAPTPASLPGFSYGGMPGPAAGEFDVVADGSSYYQLLVRNQFCDQTNLTSCITRLNGFQLTLNDVTPPTLICEDVRIDIEACNVTAGWCQPSMIEDNCPLPDPGKDQTPIQQVGGPTEGSVVAIGNYDISYEAQDTSGNVGSCTFRLIIADVLGPNLTDCVPDIVIDNIPGKCYAQPTWENPPANTNCDSALTYTYSPYSPGDIVPVGSHLITLVVSDNVNRSDTCTFNVTVLDVEPPVLCVPPQDATLPCGPAYAKWLIDGFSQWDDNCPVVLEPIFDDHFCGDTPVRQPVSWRTVANPTLGPQTTVGPKTFETADGSCVCNVLSAATTVEPAFVPCNASDFPTTRNGKRVWSQLFFVDSF